MPVTRPPAELALYLDSAPDPVFGFLHQPEGEVRGPAVLICPPFGWHDIGSYRPRRDWAQHLAAEGRPALRFDFPGAGDSGGWPRDPDRLAAWTAAVTRAAERLRELTNLDRVLAIGTGLGGVVALRAAAQGAPVDDFVLWGVPAKGKTLLREVRAFGRLEEASSSVPDDGGKAVPEGGLESVGFLMSPQTVDELGALDLTALELPEAAGRRVLMLDREGIDVDDRLRSHLEQAGLAVSTAAGTGYPEYIEEPQLAKAPREVFDTVSSWLSEGPDGAAGRAVDPGALEQEALMPADDPTVRETPFWIEGPEGRLFGVLAEPVDAPRQDLCAVLANPGALRRVGSGRMWVEIARRWAARGVPTLRLDVAGIGDSDGDAERYAQTAGLYVEELVPQVIAALDALEERGLPGRFVVMGLCSGAYWSFHAALRDARVRAAYLVNLRALFWDRSLEAARDARKARWALEGSRWRRVLTGKVPPRELARVALAAIRAPLTLGRQALKRRSQGRTTERAFDGTRDAGQRLVLVFGEDEPVHDELARDGYLDQLPSRWPNIEVRRTKGNNHTYRPLRAQHVLHAVLDSELERELDAAAPQRPGASVASP